MPDDVCRDISIKRAAELKENIADFLDYKKALQKSRKYH